MASYSIAAGAIGVYGKTLVANTVDTITFPGDVTGSIEVSTNGSAALYFTVDGSTPTVGGAATHELLAGAVAARIVQSVEVGTTVVKVISAGTPTYSVAVASMTDVPWFSSQTGTSGSAGGSGLPAGGTTSQVLKKNSGTDGDASWGGIPGPGNTGFLSLRNDFALNPSMSASALATAINSAIVSAISASKGIDFGADIWPVDSPIVVGGSLPLKAAGAAEVYGGVIASARTTMPGAAPFYKGGGLLQQGAGADILQITGTGACVHIADMVLAFGGSTAFKNTGHAVYGVPTATITGGHENGPTSCRWDNIVAFGHDGNHYAFYTVNMNYFTASQLRSYGGGGWYEECDSFESAYGNGTLIQPYFAVFIGGTADGVVMKSRTTTFPGDLNLVTLVRPQANFLAVASTPIATAYGLTSANNFLTSQYCHRDVGNPQVMCVISPNYEPPAQNTFFGTGTTVIGPEYSSRTSGVAATNNVSVGAGALPGSPTGSNNVGVGRLSVAALTTGVGNAGVGDSTLTANTTGSNNSALGNSALAANTTGSSNTAVGANALKLATASGNTAIGNNALAALTSGTNNAAVGNAALLAATTGSDNVALGYSALTATTTGIRNVAIGSNALGANTTGGNQTAVGYGALAANTSGSSNAAFGSSALPSNTTGSGNTAVGGSALAANTTGSQNTALGQNALNQNLVGNGNTAVGVQALQASTAANNTAIGYQALATNGAGAGNTAAGQAALTANTTGSDNAAVGHGSLSANTTGGLNVGLGYYALQNTSTGNQNVGIGRQAGANITAGSNNVAIGYAAGQTDGTTATTNNDSMTLIGEQAQATTGNVIVLGKAIATRPNLIFGGVGATAAFGGGVGVFAIANAATIPASNPTGGGVIYVEAGALKYRGSGGTVTTLGAA